MLLAAGRFGRAPLRTPAQLAEILPVPVYLYFSGYVTLVYPTTSNAAPSDAVGFQAIKPLPSWVLSNALPLWINGRQWQNTVVPILNDPRLARWRGRLGPAPTSPVRLPATVTPPPALRIPGVCNQSATLDGVELVTGAIIGQGISRDSAAMLYGCDVSEVKRSQGRAHEYLTLLHGVAQSYARGILLSVNTTPATATLVIGGQILNPIPGPTTPGLNNYTSIGTPDEIAAAIVAAINDPANSVSTVAYAFLAPAGSTSSGGPAISVIPTANVAITGPNGLRFGTTDQTVTLVGSAP